MVRMSSVSVPDPGEKIRLGARIITAPTATRAAATSAKIEVAAWALSRTTARHYSPSVFRQPAYALNDGRAVDVARMAPRKTILDQHFLSGAAGNRTRPKNSAELGKRWIWVRETTRKYAKLPADTRHMLMASTASRSAEVA
jgi:hypothetical protein